jgi:hypothetical protein
MNVFYPIEKILFHYNKAKLIAYLDQYYLIQFFKDNYNISDDFVLHIQDQNNFYIRIPKGDRLTYYFLEKE